MPLDLCLLGEIKLGLNGKALDNLCAEKTCALLIYLVVESDHSHRRETLAELLWPEKPEGAGRNSLKQALSQLRSALNDRDNPDPYLIASTRDLQFNTLSAFQLDVFKYEDRIKTASRHCLDQKIFCQECINLLENAAQLYRGDFLSDFYLADCPDFDEWVLAKREAYRRLQADTLSRLIQTLEANGNYTKACGYARGLVKLEPWSENSHRTLMRLLAAAGKRSAALKQYHACKAMLASEFGVEPTPLTRQLFEDIKAWNENNNWITPSNHQNSIPPIPPSDQIRPASGLRRWVILSASLSILILTGVLYILFRPDRSAARSSTENQHASSDDYAEESALTSLEATPQLTISESSQNLPPTQQEWETSEPFVIASDADDVFTIAPEDACLPGEELLYLEDFQDGLAQGWPEIEFQAQEWSIEPDPHQPINLVLTRSSTYDGNADLRDQIFRDAVWRFKILFPGEALANIGWIWNDRPYQSSQGYVEYSGFNVWFHYQDIQIYRITTPLPEVAIRFQDGVLKKDTWHNIEISTYQEILTFYVDGELIIEYQDPEPLPPGKIEIGVLPASGPDNSVPVYFDDLVVCGLNTPFVSAFSTE